jgi:Tol biopolymer transport system component
MDEIRPAISADGLSLYFSDHQDVRPGGYGKADIWVTTRETVDTPWSEPVNLGPIVNSPRFDARPCISSDDLVLLFDSWNRDGGYGKFDLYMTKRASSSDPWGTPVNIGPPVNSLKTEENPSISPDGSTLYFCSADRPGGHGDYDLWQAEFIPIVDLNGDGIVDSADMVIMVDNWGTDNSLCDIGPMPWGDGIVDVEDLIVLAEHLFEEIPPIE